MGIQRSKYLTVEDDVSRLKGTYHIIKGKKDDNDDGGTSKKNKKEDDNELISLKELNLRYCQPDEVNKKRQKF